VEALAETLLFVRLPQLPIYDVVAAKVQIGDET
jgi:hypothetical protein